MLYSKDKRLTILYFILDLFTINFYKLKIGAGGDGTFDGFYAVSGSYFYEKV